MLDQKNKWRADRGARALKTVAEIEALIGALKKDDLLDLQDIFVDSPQSALGVMANDEVQRRGLVVS